ncbi:hypothetical protein I3760_10G000700 [Carya illinoinensis]|nr:hypothetical protein I3760_10G000700 [Carya illinoinensis]KAG2682782.1 hypothetical protein I3760_10G000700 [Carya illinoinensis]
MAIARTGVYVDDYLEYASTLPAELQRLLNTIRELDERSQSMINQTGQQTKYCLGLASQSSKKGNSNNSCSYYYNNNNNSQEDEVAIEKMRKDIDSSQDNALSLCTEKVLLARQAYDLIDSHVKRLDEDLNNFAEDLKQGRGSGIGSVIGILSSCHLQEVIKGNLQPQSMSINLLIQTNLPTVFVIRCHLEI